MLQLVADGLMLGATVSLGAIGLTLTYSILRFANFTHGEFVTIGAYAALAALAGFAGLVADGLVADAGTFGELSFGWPLVAALLLAVLVTGGVAVLLDWLLFRRLRRHGSAIVMVIASFGASLALRNLIAFGFGPQPDYFSRALQMSIELVPGLRVTPETIPINFAALAGWALLAAGAAWLGLRRAVVA